MNTNTWDKARVDSAFISAVSSAINPLDNQGEGDWQVTSVSYDGYEMEIDVNKTETEATVYPIFMGTTLFHSDPLILPAGKVLNENRRSSKPAA